jgi:TP901 family phage tail tape measure protein
LAIDKVSSVLGGIKDKFGVFAIGVAAAAVAAGGEAIHMAADFQQSMTRLVTGAGEAQSNMKLVSNGILAMAGQVGESTHDLAAGMYLVESAGFHGADGLNVLKLAAQGAKVGNADMATVADAVTTALNAYHMSAKDAAAATNALIAAEGQGKTNLEALSGSLSTVAPIASVAHVSLNEVLAAMATMTGQGTDAASAATYLKQTIGQLSNPTGKAAQEMRSLGLDATQVSLNLGKNGLASTLQMLTDAIEKKMGPAGTVLIEHLQKAAKNTTAFQQVLAQLPPSQQTYIGALANMVGGTKSMQAALELTGDNMAVFRHNTDVINEKVKAGGQNIEGWSLVQKNFNQRLAEAKGVVEATSIRIGQMLLPAATATLGVIMSSVGWFTRHKDVTRDLGIAAGLLAAAFLTYKIAVFAMEAPTMAATAAQWALNVAMDANPIGLIIVAIVALVAAIVYLWTHNKGFRDFFIAAWHDIWGALKAVGAWFAGPFADFFVAAWHVIAGAALWLWHNVLDPLWQGISAGIAFVVNIVRSFINLWRDVGTFLWNTVYNGYIKPTVDGIGIAVNWLWHNAIHPVVAGIIIEWNMLSAAAAWLWHNAIEPAFHGIASVATWLWSNVLSPAFSAIDVAVHAIGHTFSVVFSAIGGFISSAFHDAVGVVKSAINGIIGLINSAIGFINGNMIDAANKLPGVSFPHIPRIPYLAAGGDITRAGMAVVGDQGAEVVSLPAGTRVFPHGSDAGGGPSVTVNVYAGIGTDGRDVGRQIAEYLRPYVVGRGGNVQVALGR